MSEQAQVETPAVAEEKPAEVAKAAADPQPELKARTQNRIRTLIRERNEEQAKRKSAERERDALRIQVADLEQKRKPITPDPARRRLAEINPAWL